MLAYILRRLLLIIPTLLIILLVNFVIVQAAPGGPVERMIAQLRGMDAGAGGQFAGSRADFVTTDTGGGSGYRGSQGLPPELLVVTVAVAASCGFALSAAILGYVLAGYVPLWLGLPFTVSAAGMIATVAGLQLALAATIPFQAPTSRL